MLPSRVKEIIGIPEDQLVHSSNREEYIKEINGKLYFTNDERDMPIGEFSTPSIKELRKYSSNVPASTNQCDFTVLENVDIGVLQSNLKTSDRAMVQVASNFNCLEVSSRHTPPNYGSLVECTERDSTQGPAACFGPLAAYLYRAHFVFPEGQTNAKQVNLLENVSDYFGVPVNGKLTLNGDESSIAHIESVVNAIKIGLHTDVSVIYGRDKDGMNFELDEPYPVIDQCFNSTINLHDYGKVDLSKDNAISIMRTLLRAAYEGVYLSAILRQRDALYLTLIGGGVFANPKGIILEEMVRAHQKWANHSLSTLKNVYLCLYGSDKNVIEYLKNM